MKKIVFFLSAMTALTFTSCSSDDNASTSPDTSTSVLPKRVVWEEDDPDGFQYDINYTYNGNKLFEANYVTGEKEKYYYTGDLITKIDHIYGGEIEFQEFFEYDLTGRLVLSKYQDIAEDWQERSVFVYNNDGTVTESYYTESLNFPSTNPSVRVLTFVNGEMTKLVQQGNNTYNYSYDGKNSPFKNVTGYAAIVYASHDDYETEGKSQNIASIFDVTENMSYTANTFEYNANNYPTKVTSVANLSLSNPSSNNQLVLKYYYQ